MRHLLPDQRILPGLTDGLLGRFVFLPMDGNDEPVAAPYQSLDIARIVAGITESQPEFHHRGIDTAVKLHHRVVGPQTLADFLARNYAAFGNQKHGENLELLLRQEQAAAISAQFGGIEIEIEWSEANKVRHARLQIGMGRSVSQQGQSYYG